MITVIERWMWASCSLLLAAPTPCQQEAVPAPLRIGIIGCDTSHAVAFTKIFNDPDNEGDVARMRVVAAWPGGTDIPASRDRVAGITEQVRAQGVRIVESIGELLDRVDFVLLESVDGGPHLEQARAVIAAEKPVFIDKPLAGSLADAVAIAELAAEHGVPWFSSSSLRFSEQIIRHRLGDERVGEVRGCDAWSPCTIEPTHPDLFWYGVHGVETLFTIMGTGCERVTRVQTDGAELVVGVWEGGRIGTFRGLRDGKRDYGAVVFGTAGVVRDATYEGYRPLVEAIARFFLTGEPPVEAVETLEIYAFMEAADESRRLEGSWVLIEDTLVRAREAARGVFDRR